jgi:hypothetical protein
MDPLATSTDRPEPRPNRSWSGSRALFGLFLFLFGGLLLLDRFGWVDAYSWSHLWPLLPIAIGVIKLVQPRHEGGRFFGGLLIVIFGAILLRNLGWFDFEIDGDLILPGVLLLIGIRLMTTSRRWRGRHLSGSDSSDEIGTFAVLGSSRVTSTSTSFRGGNASALMGGCVVDLRQASMPAGSEAVLDVFAFWGGIDVLVPENWAVVVSGTPILAGFEDKTQPPAEPAGRLVIKGFAVMGGVEIKNRRRDL